MGRHIERNKPRSGKDSSRAVRTKPGRPGKPKVCVFCVSHAIWVDYKDVNVLRRLMSDRGKIKARRVTGTCRQHQRDVAIAIKTAREMALLPYVVIPSAADKGGGRNGRGAPRGGPRRPFGADDATPTAAGDGVDGADGADAVEPTEFDGDAVDTVNAVLASSDD